MAEEESVLASAVVVPEEAQPLSQASPPPPEQNGSLKRRQSSISSISSKRPRLSVDGATDSIAANSPPQDTPSGTRSSDRAPSRKASLQMDKHEERRRGKRLFGAVLGTLSQSNTTAAQRRRADIEKKQQAKLRLQAEEDEAVRKQRLDELQRKRRKDQWVFDEQSMKIRHENMRATARFLRTKAEPRLYYKPYELRPDEEDRIRRQLEDVEDEIDRELDEWDDRRRRAREEERESPPRHGLDGAGEKETRSRGPSKNGNEATTNDEAAAINGHDRNHDQVNGDDTKVGWDAEASRESNGTTSAHVEQEGSKEAADDGGEIVEGEEDTVIY